MWFISFTYKLFLHYRSRIKTATARIKKSIIVRIAEVTTWLFIALVWYSLLFLSLLFFLIYIVWTHSTSQNSNILSKQRKFLFTITFLIYWVHILLRYDLQAWKVTFELWIAQIYRAILKLILLILSYSTGWV